MLCLWRTTQPSAAAEPMSYIRRRAEPEPPQRSPCQLMLEELADIWAFLETLSARMAGAAVG
jgi:hypothetical protein